MNQNERDDLAIYLGLQEFEVTLMEVETSRRRGRIKVLHVSRHSGTHRCRDCGREHAEGLFEEDQAAGMLSWPHSGFGAYLGPRCAPRWSWCPIAATDPTPETLGRA